MTLKPRYQCIIRGQRTIQILINQTYKNIVQKKIINTFNTMISTYKIDVLKTKLLFVKLKWLTFTTAISEIHVWNLKKNRFSESNKYQNGMVHHIQTLILFINIIYVINSFWHSGVHLFYETLYS